MHILYLDDSGSPTNRQEEYFVLGAISVPESAARWLTYQIEIVAQEVHPTDPSSIELHAAEIFGGRDLPWSSITNRADRIAIIKKVLSTIPRTRPGSVLFGCAVHKASSREQDVVIQAYEDISSRFDQYLQRLSEETNAVQRGVIVIDKSSYETGLQNLASQIRKTGNRWGNQTRNIVEVPLFVDSKASRMVQLADHIAYGIFRRYNADDLSYMRIFEHRFDQTNGKICGLSHKFANARTCQCPACLSRR